MNWTSMKMTSYSKLQGLKQFKSSCYFNSVFNAFLLGSMGRKMLYNAYLDYKLFLIKEQKVDAFFYCIDTLMTQPDFFIQTMDVNVLKMYFFAFISIFMCHKVNKKISSTNVDNLMASIREQRIPMFGSKINSGGYSLQTLGNLTKTMGLGNPIIMNTLSVDNIVHISEYNPLFVVLGSNQRNVFDVIHVKINNVLHKYKLCHAILQIFYEKPPGHAVMCSISNEQPIVYDSNKDDILFFDWTKLGQTSNTSSFQTFKNYFDCPERIRKFEFLYICYVEENFIESLEDIPRECEWSGSINNTAYMIQQKLALNPSQVCHLIIYDNTFLQTILFIDDTYVRYQNMFFYNNNNDNIPVDLENNIITNSKSEVLVYVICSKDCTPTTRKKGSLTKNKIREYVEDLKLFLSRFQQPKNIFIHQVEFSAVELGYIGHLMPKYHKVL